MELELLPLKSAMGPAVLRRPVEVQKLVISMCRGNISSDVSDESTHFETDKFSCLVMEFCPGGKGNQGSIFRSKHFPCIYVNCGLFLSQRSVENLLSDEITYFVL
ncbi:hypothetical protein Q3G72_020088 [Acer saccharum]|nr:hypothetical protein Q3G72_020088 [Acer saccharum]